MTTQRMLQRPLHGGAFGDGVYSLATLPTISNGLHAVRFFVIEPRRGTVLSVADDKLQAIASARRLLTTVPAPVAANDPAWEQKGLWPDIPVDRAAPPRKVSMRRRQIFERSQGRCHYCAAPLALDGKWHVEHGQPKALGGTDDPLNLFAACVRCNLSKGSRTALQYVAGVASATSESPECGSE
jgi:hypothetical protein